MTFLSIVQYIQRFTHSCRLCFLYCVFFQIFFFLLYLWFPWHIFTLWREEGASLFFFSFLFILFSPWLLSSSAFALHLSFFTIFQSPRSDFMSSKMKPQTLLSCRFWLVLLGMEFCSEMFLVDNTSLSKLYLFTCILTKSAIQCIGCSYGICIAVNWVDSGIHLATFWLYIALGKYIYIFHLLLRNLPLLWFKINHPFRIASLLWFVNKFLADQM